MIVQCTAEDNDGMAVEIIGGFHVSAPLEYDRLAYSAHGESAILRPKRALSVGRSARIAMSASEPRIEDLVAHYEFYPNFRIVVVELLDEPGSDQPRPQCFWDKLTGQCLLPPSLGRRRRVRTPRLSLRPGSTREKLLPKLGEAITGAGWRFTKAQPRRFSSSCKTPVHRRLIDLERFCGGKRAARPSNGQEVLEIVPVKHGPVMHF